MIVDNVHDITVLMIYLLMDWEQTGFFFTFAALSKKKPRKTPNIVQVEFLHYPSLKCFPSLVNLTNLTLCKTYMFGQSMILPIDGPVILFPLNDEGWHLITSDYFIYDCIRYLFMPFYNMKSRY